MVLFQNLLRCEHERLLSSGFLDSTLLHLQLKLLLLVFNLPVN